MTRHYRVGGWGSEQACVMQDPMLTQEDSTPALPYADAAMFSLPSTTTYSYQSQMAANEKENQAGDGAVCTPVNRVLVFRSHH
jgi:hypothetical protein